MTPLLQKLPVSHNMTFVATTFKTPHFEVPWHLHSELELILFTEGSGKSYVGDYIGDFSEGDIYFIGANVPHTFQRDPIIPVTSAVVIQFNADFWGDRFLELPEAKSIKCLFDIAEKGIKVSEHPKRQLNKMIRSLEGQLGFERIINLCGCLNIVASDPNPAFLSTQTSYPALIKHQKRLSEVFQYTKSEFYRPISLNDIAGKVNMSVPAFCEYFKKSVKKTYVEFLNEIRLSNACKLLLETELSVTEIYLRSGYNNPAHFNKQFLKLKGIPPFQYRKIFTDKLIHSN